MSLVGGMTIFASGRGRWKDSSGKECTEKIIPVRIMCSKKQMEKIVKFTMLHYRQQAVMFYEVTEKVKIVSRKDIL